MSRHPSTDDIIAIIDYVCGYACKDSEPTGATADLFKDMVNNVDTTNADQISGKSMCAKMLIKTVGRRGISGPEASFKLSGLAPSTTTVYILVNVRVKAT